MSNSARERGKHQESSSCDLSVVSEFSLTAKDFDSVASIVCRIHLETLLGAEQVDADSGFILLLPQQSLKPAPETEAIQLLQLLLTLHSVQFEHVWAPHLDLLDILHYRKPEPHRTPDCPEAEASLFLHSWFNRNQIQHDSPEFVSKFASRLAPQSFCNRTCWTLTGHTPFHPEVLLLDDYYLSLTSRKR